MIDKKIKSRVLPERSFLYYSYPQISGKRNIEFLLPMLQNINVRESQRSRLGIIDLLGRSGNLFTFQGANSRQFNVSFSMNLDHVNHYARDLGLPNVSFQNVKKSSKFNWKPEDKNSEVKLNYCKLALNNLVDVSEKTSISIEEKNVAINSLIRSLIGAELPGDRAQLDSKVELAERLSTETYRNYNDISVNLFVLFLNVIRTSTIGNSENTSLGPPTIYLNHGTLYNNIPCICTNYSISVEETSTYEIYTLTPKIVKVTLELSENRTGDFGRFEPFKYVSNENLAGWECLIEKGTMDPYSDAQQYDYDSFEQSIDAKAAKSLRYR